MTAAHPITTTAMPVGAGPMVRWLSALGLVLSCVALLAAAPARAEFGIAPGSFTADVFQQDGSLATQAGGHPYEAVSTFDFNLRPDGSLDERIKDIVVDLPAGFVGDPQATPTCPAPIYGELAVYGKFCPPSSQVGVAYLTAASLPNFPPTTYPVPVYNIPNARGEAAAFGVSVGGVPIRLAATVRNTTDRGITVTAKNVSNALLLYGQRLVIWGVPADPSHDSQRVCDINHTNGDPGTATCTYSLNAERRPFLTNPTSCAGPQEVRSAVSSWQDPTDVKTLSTFTQAGADGCDRVPFDPSFEAVPDARRPDAPTGLSVGLTFPVAGLRDPDGISTAHLKDATVTLPEGMTINPGGAGGLAACTDEQLGLGTMNELGCPEASKVGTVTATTPLLDETLDGEVFLRSQASDDPESGDMFRLALVLREDNRGIFIKLPGSVRANASTGRLTATFKDNPQLPVDHIELSFKSGPRAPLVTPQACGTQTVDAQLVSWAGQDVQRPSRYGLECVAGLGGFAPSFSAGATSPVGGGFSSFALSIAKPDGNADINGLSMVLPAGLLAKVKGNVGAQVGTVKAFAGPGSSPFVLPGKVFLEGPYGDAPFSLRVVVPAKAGPFDLGDVVVRQRIYVDPIDAHVTVVSDPIPTIVKGVPARLQRLEVAVDKPDFIINPTSCAAKTISGTLGSVAGQSVPVTNRFQVSDCGSLALKPALSLSLSGKGQTRDGGHPAISATLTQPAGGANLKKVRVALPSSVALDPDNAASDGLCSFVEGSKPLPVCPASSVVGKATAVSPILNEPLSGPVYFVKNERKDPKSGRSIKTTPKLVIPLTGENGVKLTLTGVSSVPDNVHLVTTFEAIPDAPVSSFKLDINGGKKGILVVSGTDICKATQIADQQVDGQNNKAADADIYIQTPSCPLKVMSKTVGKTSVAVKVGGLAAGKVTVTGKGIKKTTKTITKSTVATITAHRTSGRLSEVKVSFLPKGAKKARTATVTLR